MSSPAPFEPIADLLERSLSIRHVYGEPVRRGDTIVIPVAQVAYGFGELDELALAYACSIHKSQGSEYPAVIVPVHTQHYIMLQRNLLYTALTRGKRLVVLVGSKRALARAVGQQDTAKRWTMLRQRLRGV